MSVTANEPGEDLLGAGRTLVRRFAEYTQDPKLNYPEFSPAKADYLRRLDQRLTRAREANGRETTDRYNPPSFQQQHLVDLADFFERNGLFQMVVNHGNWKAHIPSRRGLEMAALASYKLLATHGLLIDDARNYSIIIPERPKSLDVNHPPKGNLSAWDRKIVYCGDKVDQEALLALDDLAVFRYSTKVDDPKEGLKTYEVVIAHKPVMAAELEQISSGLRIPVLTTKDGKPLVEGQKYREDEIEMYRVKAFAPLRLTRDGKPLAGGASNGDDAGVVIVGDYGLKEVDKAQFHQVVSTKLDPITQINGSTHVGSLQDVYRQANAAKK
jgi:hypothetical protein